MSATDKEYWNRVLNELEGAGISETKFTYVWSRYCEELDELDWEICFNDREFFVELIEGLSPDAIYDQIAINDYNVADAFARADNGFGYPESANTAFDLISWDERKQLTDWVREKTKDYDRNLEGGYGI